MSDTDWMDRRDVAREFDVPERTVDDWRYRGVGPPAYKIGRHVRYRRSEVTAWAKSRAISA